MALNIYIAELKGTIAVLKGPGIYMENQKEWYPFFEDLAEAFNQVYELGKNEKESTTSL